MIIHIDDASSIDLRVMLVVGCSRRIRRANMGRARGVCHREKVAGSSPCAHGYSILHNDGVAAFG